MAVGPQAVAKRSLMDLALRVLLTSAHKILILSWIVRQPKTLGAHALALTPERKLILVKLRYARGWRVPGGGQHPDEDAEEAVLRELREEIGMTGHGRVRVACEVREPVDFKRDLSTLLVVEDVIYSPPRWSLEVEQVAEFAPNRLPSDAAAKTLRWVEQLRGMV